jgi:ribosomal protein L11 methyltransferase
MSGETWLEASLLADGEMAEAISEVMTRFVSGGVVIESTQITDEIDGEGRVTGLLKVSGYLLVDERLDETKQKLQEALWHLGQIRPVAEVQFSPVANLDWSEVWKEHFQPVQIGEKLVVIPEWMDDDRDNQIAIKIDPGMAFGTGTHPTTQLCLEIITDFLESINAETKKSVSMIDVGCGSGILGIAALKMGVGKVLGVDVDPEAVTAAHQNAKINGIDENLEIAVGSLGEIKASRFSFSRGQVVAANILAPVITRMLEEGLGELVAPGGKLILSGILADQVPEIESGIMAANLKLVQKRQMGDWMALVAEKAAPIFPATGY